jgi:transketolase
LLEESGVAARVVSVPSHELFLRQDPAYRDSVLPAGLPRVAVEAAHPMSWYRLVGDRGTVIGIDRFGASAPYQRLYEEYGITPGAVAEAARKLLR